MEQLRGAQGPPSASVSVSVSVTLGYYDGGKLGWSVKWDCGIQRTVFVHRADSKMYSTLALYGLDSPQEEGSAPQAPSRHHADDRAWPQGTGWAVDARAGRPGSHWSQIEDQ